MPSVAGMIGPIAAVLGASAGPLSAGEDVLPVEPLRVELRTYGVARLTTDWHGNGMAVLATDLCVASSTGRYRVRLLNESLDAPRAQLGYDVEFRDGAGRSQRAIFDGLEVAFEGSSPQVRDCSGGSNARLIIRVPEAELLEKSAGRYVDSLRIVADAV